MPKARLKPRQSARFTKLKINPDIAPIDTIHHWLCDLLNIIYTKPPGEEYSWTWTELIICYGFIVLISTVLCLAGQ